MALAGANGADKGAIPGGGGGHDWGASPAWQGRLTMGELQKCRTVVSQRPQAGQEPHRDRGQDRSPTVPAGGGWTSSNPPVVSQTGSGLLSPCRAADRLNLRFSAESATPRGRAGHESFTLLVPGRRVDARGSHGGSLAQPGSCSLTTLGPSPFPRHPDGPILRPQTPSSLGSGDQLESLTTFCHDPNHMDPSPALALPITVRSLLTGRRHGANQPQDRPLVAGPLC